MGTRTFTVSYPEELLQETGKTAEEFETELLFVIAAKLYEVGRITWGQQRL